MKKPRFISVTPQFSKKRIEVYIASRVQEFQDAAFERMKRVGETFVTNARNNGGYQDQTGNLRSSIGFVILKDGEQVFESFPGDKVEGKSRGRSLVKALIQDLNKRRAKGFLLIGVAGMDYAAAVESRGKDVITGSSLIAKDDLKKSLQALQKKFKK